VKVVALETSGTRGSVALLDGARLLAEHRLPADERSARSLLPCLKAMLDEHGWRPTDVEMVGVTTGPGSFTGLRIGVVTAKTFAYATGAHLVGVHTLAAIAAGVGEAVGRLWTLLDAQRGELFVATFAPGRHIADDDPPVTEILAVPRWMDGLNPGDVVAGPPLAKWRDQLPAGVIVADEAAWSPMAGATGRLTVEQFQRHGGVSPMELVPQYYRKSAAEEKAAKP